MICLVDNWYNILSSSKSKNDLHLFSPKKDLQLFCPKKEKENSFVYASSNKKRTKLFYFKQRNASVHCWFFYTNLPRTLLANTNSNFGSATSLCFKLNWWSRDPRSYYVISVISSFFCFFTSLLISCVFTFSSYKDIWEKKICWFQPDDPKYCFF